MNTAIEFPKDEVIGKVISILSFVLGAFTLYTSIFGLMTAVIQRGLVLAVALLIAFCQLLKKAKPGFSLFKVIDTAMAFLSVGTGAYIVLTFKSLVQRAGAYNQWDIIISYVLFAVLIYAAVRTLGWPMVIIALTFVAYAMFGRYLPPPFGHAGYKLARVLPYLVLGTEGIYGTSMGVAAGVIIVYSLFGGFMEIFGVGDYFIKVAYGMVGRSKGGSAKASIVASGLMGTVSGSAVANILTTGNFTLPLMIKSGYAPMTAAAILAVAASGGLIMPPVMGAAAFVMSEMRGVSYGSIAVAAIIPAVLYYASLFIQAGFEADKIGMKALTKEELPANKDAIKEVYLFLPLIVLFVLLIFFQYPASPSACVAMAIIVVLAFFKKETKPTPNKLYKAISEGGSAVISTILTCATAGIIVGIITLTGLGVKVSAVIMAMSGNAVYLALFFAMLIALLLGMGMPPVAAYIIMASMIVPSLVHLGVEQLAADMFVFFFSCIGNITPPVALAAFTAAGMVQVNPFQTGYLAAKFGLVSFIIPYAFCTSSSLLLQGDVLSIITSLVSALVGVFALSIALTGWYKGAVNIAFRGLLTLAALCTIMPGLPSDIIGYVIVGGTLTAMYMMNKNKRKALAG